MLLQQIGTHATNHNDNDNACFAAANQYSYPLDAIGINAIRNRIHLWIETYSAK